VVSSNGLVSIFGKDFAPDGTKRDVSSSDLVNGMLPNNLASVCVLFGTQRAPMLLVMPEQLNVQVPLVTESGTTTVQVIRGCDTANAVYSLTFNVMVQSASPEFFYFTS